MRTLVYKRTHHGDPNRDGHFGIHDCMGQVRSWDFEAVIGVGGLGAEPTRHGIEGKVNWIGIGPRVLGESRRGPILGFAHFLFLGSDGPHFLDLAPRLANRIYRDNIRVLMNGVDRREQSEIAKLLRMARSAPASKGYRARKVISECRGRGRARACRCGGC